MRGARGWQERAHNRQAPPNALTTRCLLRRAAATLAGSLRCPSFLPRPVCLAWPRPMRRSARPLPPLVGACPQEPPDSLSCTPSLTAAAWLPGTTPCDGWVARGTREFSAAAHCLMPAFAATAAARCVKPTSGAGAATAAAVGAGSLRTASSGSCWLDLLSAAGLAALGFLAAGAAGWELAARCT